MPHASSRTASRLTRVPLALLLALSFLAHPAATPAQPLPVDPHTTLLLHLDGDANDADFETPSTLENVGWTTGRIGSAVTLDGGDLLYYPLEGNLVGETGSLEFWLRPAWNGNDGLNHTVLECGAYGGMLVDKDANGYFRIILNRYGPNGTSELGVSLNVSSEWVAGAWHHCAFTWSSTSLVLYVDGASRQSRTLSTPPPALVEPSFQLGAQGMNAPLLGELDELRISASVRTAGEIATAATGVTLARDATTLFLAHFDGVADGAAGQQPLAATGVAYETGVLGQAATLTGASDLTVRRPEHLRGLRGTIEFWLKPTWNGDDGQSHVALACGTWGGLLVVKDGGGYWRLILNRWAPGGTPEMGVGLYVGGWTPGAWRHCAFTWDPDALRAYVDGVLVASEVPAMVPPELTAATFSVGRESSADGLDGALDELRISDVARTAAEIQAGYVAGLEILALHATPDSALAWPTWTVRPTLTADTPHGSVSVPLSLVDWTVSDPAVLGVDGDGDLIATGGGLADATATLKSHSAVVRVRVRPPVLAPTHEELPADLLMAPDDARWQVPVLILRYFATADGVNLDTSISPDFWELGPIPLADLDANVLAMNRRAKFALEEGSRFRAYSNPHARHSLGYRVVDQITVYEQTPPGKVLAEEAGHPLYEPDWFSIFERFDVRHYVEDLGVKEIWVWLGGLGDWPSFDPAIHDVRDFRGGWESNMSSPVSGDISNSDRDPADLPVYANTYVVYGYNFRRSQAEAIHDHGHQLEAQFGHVNVLQDGNTDLFWRLFRGQDEWGERVTGRCGDTHSPPNTLAEYDYENPTPVASDIADWRPDGSGTWQEVDADTWGSRVYAWPDGETDFGQRVETQWYMYWMMSMPGFANGITHGSEYLTDWWEFVGDWDMALSGGHGLHASEPMAGVTDGPAPRPALALGRVTPNPVTGSAAVSLTLGRAGALRVEVFDAQGRRVRTLCDGLAPAGERRLAWDARGEGGARVRPGVYLLRASTGDVTVTRRVCVLR